LFDSCLIDSTAHSHSLTDSPPIILVQFLQAIVSEKDVKVKCGRRGLGSSAPDIGTESDTDSGSAPSGVSSYSDSGSSSSGDSGKGKGGKGKGSSPSSSSKGKVRHVFTVSNGDRPSSFQFEVFSPTHSLTFIDGSTG